MDGFIYPLDIWFYGRPYTFRKFVMRDDVKYAVYEETELGVQQAFTENLFKFHEHYGNITRGQR